MRSTKYKRNVHQLTILLAGVFAMSGIVGCAQQQLQYQGSTVQVVQQLNRTDCENLGPVYGKGGGAFGGGLLSDEALMEYATNALRNEAGKRGATHVTFASHQMGSAIGGPTTATATISGIAWKCRSTKTPPKQPTQITVEANETAQDATSQEPPTGTQQEPEAPIQNEAP